MPLFSLGQMYSGYKNIIALFAFVNDFFLMVFHIWNGYLEINKSVLWKKLVWIILILHYSIKRDINIYKYILQLIIHES